MSLDHFATLMIWAHAKSLKKSLLKSFKLHSQTPFMLYRLEPRLK